MEYCSKLVLSLCSVLMLTTTCYGCYTNYQTCYNEFSSVPAPTGENTDRTAYCNAASSALTCLENDASDCTATVPQQYVNYRDILTNVKASCVSADCGKAQQKCSNQTLEAFKLLPQGPNSGIPDASVVGQYCQSMGPAIQCYRDLIPLCPSLGDLNATIVQFESQFSPLCGGKGAGGVGCFQKSLECVNISSTIGDALNFGNGTDISAILNVMSTLCPILSRVKGCFAELVIECPTMAANITSQLKTFDTLSQSCPDNAPTTVSVCDGNECNSGTMSVVSLMVTFLGVTLALI